MKTLTITEGRGRLGFWLKKAVAGEDIGFVFGDKIIALRPVEIYSGDYALHEYGLKWQRRCGGTKKNIAGERKRGTLKPSPETSMPCEIKTTRRFHRCFAAGKGRCWRYCNKCNRALVSLISTRD